MPNTPFEGSERYATLFLGMNQTEDVNFDYFQPFAGVVVGQGSITTDSRFNAGAFRPYVGGGIGFTLVSQDARISGLADALVDDSDKAFAGQIGFGVRYKLG